MVSTEHIIFQVNISLERIDTFTLFSPNNIHAKGFGGKSTKLSYGGSTPPVDTNFNSGIS